MWGLNSLQLLLRHQLTPPPLPTAHSSYTPEFPWRRRTCLEDDYIPHRKAITASDMWHDGREKKGGLICGVKREECLIACRVCFNNTVVCKRTWMACKWKHCGILPVTTFCFAATSMNSERDMSLGVVWVPQHVCIQSLLKPLRASALPAELGKRPDTCHPAPSGSCLSGTWTCCRMVSMWAGSRLHPQTRQRSNSGFYWSFFFGKDGLRLHYTPNLLISSHLS